MVKALLQYVEWSVGGQKGVSHLSSQSLAAGRHSLMTAEASMKYGLKEGGLFVSVVELDMEKW